MYSFIAIKSQKENPLSQLPPFSADIVKDELCRQSLTPTLQPKLLVYLLFKGDALPCKNIFINSYPKENKSQVSLYKASEPPKRSM